MKNCSAKISSHKKYSWFTAVIIATFISSLSSLKIKSQTLAPPEEVSIIAEVIDAPMATGVQAENLTNPLSVLSTDDQAIYKVVFRVSDTLNIQTIHVDLGTQTGGSDIASFNFSFDDYSGNNYQRFANTICLTLGAYHLAPTVVCSVRCIDTSGKTSAVALSELKMN